MATTKLTTHIPPDANPTNVSEMVVLLARTNQTFKTVSDLLDFTESQGIGSRTEMQSIAQDMGLLEKARDGIKLSPNGYALASLREDIRGDILHFLMYTGWNVKKPLEFMPSWAYRDCCDRYWQAGSLTLSSDYIERQVQETINKARSEFEALQIGEFEEVSFSRKSLSGAHKWMESLNPPVLELSVDRKGEQVFNRRSFCPPELLLLAIGYVLRDEPEAIEFDVLLTHEKQDRICAVCLLEPEALDRTLDWAIPIFPTLIEPGTSAGFYGRFIRLHRLPNLADIVR
jgi:hypothetical protein